MRRRSPVNASWTRWASSSAWLPRWAAATISPRSSRRSSSISSRSSSV
ncbi:hypothetical protein KIF24_01445 [Micromonospora sp. Llam7]|nr:hypothetical protein [Micromonospora tarapacensis]MBX7264849.1 hypothetical protein [Micromonospora tarapacensis]